jgi:hypothetical protein
MDGVDGFRFSSGTGQDAIMRFLRLVGLDLTPKPALEALPLRR